MSGHGHPPTEFKPGQIGNPKGNNQYTYRREAEKAFDRLLTVRRRGDDAKPGRALDRILTICIEQAEEGRPYALDQVLKRILPVIERHALVDTGELGEDMLGDRLAALVATRTTNGSGRPVEPPGKNGSGGGDP